ncbi:MAG TPA: CotH kinase family protein [Candidatus Kapabacteria bacterium]|nr:CotH kinase family protein [Candidatus Kapabacteria bacterium]
MNIPSTLPSDDSIRVYFRRTGKEVRKDPAFAPGGEHFDAIISAYLPLVYGTALKLLPGQPDSARRISLAAFELLATKWQRVAKGGCSVSTLIAHFLLHAAVSASERERKRIELGKPVRGLPEAEHAFLFKRFFRLNKKAQRCVLLFDILRYPPGMDSPKMAGYEKRAAKAVRTLARNLRKTSLGANMPAALAGIPTPAPAELEAEIIDSIRRWTVTTPGGELTRATLLSWRWIAVGRFFKRVLATTAVVICVLAVLAFTFVTLAQRGYFMMFFIRMEANKTLERHPELKNPGRPWPVTDEDRARVASSNPQTASELYQPTNIWLAKLSFTQKSWDAIQPERVPPVPHLFNGGQIQLRNPKAKRSGLAGALGFHFEWVPAEFEFAGVRYTNVAARFRGNGTFLNSLYGPKQSLKVDLNKFTKKQSVAGVDELNFVNSIPDSSYVHDSMAHRLFRDLGAAAPRTAYAYVSMDVPGKWTNQPIGLYNIIENIDKDFAEETFGTKKVPIFKPVTYELFHDLGQNWTNYAAIYDLKADASAAQLQRVVDFAQLVSHASDKEYADRIAEFLDLEAFAGYLAATVLMSSYDGFLANGQNYFMYLHPETDRFGFVGWDQDHSWGEFPFVGSVEDREQASIWKPWVSGYDFRFLKRTMKVPAFRELYKKKLEDALETIFTKERLYSQIDQLAAAIRPAVAAESDFRLRRFDQAVSDEWLKGPRDNRIEGPDAPPHQIKRFIEARIKSVRAQLKGESEGIQLKAGFGGDQESEPE